MSSELPTVSIIVLAYENIRYLPATIYSILQQTDCSFEVLVFSDDYHQIYSWFQRQPDPRLRFILQNKFNLATTLNQGIIEARGRYISLIKTGDLWHPSKLQKQVSYLDRDSQVDLIHSPSISIARHSRSLYIPTRKAVRSGIDTTGNWRKGSEILAQNQLVLSSVMLRRSCFDKVGLFDPKLQITPDWEMWIRLSHYSEFIATAEPLVYCRQLQENRRENWLRLETDLQITIEKAYALLPCEPEKKQRSYSYASLFLAQHVLQHKNPDSAVAHNYWYQALQHDSSIIFSAEFCRLRWIIFSLNCLQSDRYYQLKQLSQAMSDRLKSIVYKVREYSQKVVNWMLEEEESIIFWKNRKVKRQGKD